MVEKLDLLVAALVVLCTRDAKLMYIAKHMFEVEQVTMEDDG